MKYTNKDIKKFPKKSGIYKIYFKNSKSNKVYIGSASGKLGFYGRWKSHISSLSNGKSKNNILQLATNKYKIDNLIFEVIEYCNSVDCLIREQYYIDEYNSYEFGYNGRPKSSNNGCLPMNKSTKDKISNKWKVKRDMYVDDVKRLYEIENKTTREICEILNISRNFLRKIFIENNIHPRKESGLKKTKIYQYKNGFLINEWDSLNECVRNNNFNSNGIRSVIIGKCIHYKGFYFSYEILNKSEVLDIEDKFKINANNRKYYYYKS